MSGNERAAKIVRAAHRFRHARVIRWIFPTNPRVPVAQDLVAVNEARRRQLRSLWGGGFALIPALGFILVVVNLFYRVDGDANLATAIVLNIPISALAMIILISFMHLLFIVISNALAMVIGHYETAPQVRYWSFVGYLLLVFVMTATLPWFILAIILATSFAYWRIERTKSPAPPSPLAAWLSSPTPPQDGELRQLWLEGRWALHRRGEAVVPSKHFELRVPDPFRGRDLSAIREDVVLRARLINESAPFTGFGRLASVLLIALVTQAAQLVATPVNFAPYELLVTGGDETRSGYVLDSGDSLLLLNRELNTGVYIRDSDVEARSVCEPSAWIQTTAQLVTGAAPRSNTVDCRDHEDW